MNFYHHTPTLIHSKKLELGLLGTQKSPRPFYPSQHVDDSFISRERFHSTHHCLFLGCSPITTKKESKWRSNYAVPFVHRTFVHLMTLENQIGNNSQVNKTQQNTKTRRQQHALVAHTCNSSYLGVWVRKITVWDQPGQIVHETPISKITREKWTRPGVWLKW
jgi:hypothetical protein